MTDEKLEQIKLTAARAEVKEELRRLVQLYLNYLRAAESVTELYTDRAYEEALAGGFQLLSDLGRLRKEGVLRVGMVSTSLLNACVPWKDSMPAFCAQVATNVTNCNAVLRSLAKATKPRRRQIIVEFQLRGREVMNRCQQQLDRIEGGVISDTF